MEILVPAAAIPHCLGCHMMEDLGLVEASPGANLHENCRAGAHTEPVHYGVADPQHSRLGDKVKKATGMSSDLMRMESLRG